MNHSDLQQEFEKRVAELIRLLGFSATIQVDILELEERKYFDVKVEIADNASELIGYHGRNLDALATILTMMMPKTEERFGVLLDINSYREERKQYIKGETERAIEQAIAENTAIELDPMKPWERRVVHMTTVGRTDIITESVGEEPDRRVVIKPS